MSYPESCRLQPRPAQLDGTRALLGKPPRAIRGCFALFDAVGVGKSKQVLDALCEAYTRQWSDAMIAVTPGFARSVWASDNPLLGQCPQHVWTEVPYRLTEYCVRTDALPWDQLDRPLDIVTTNYEFLRREDRLDKLVEWASRRRTWLVLDETWAVKTHNAQQTKAVKHLRKSCQCVVLLNGTPGRPEELYSQFDIMDPRIIGVKNFWAFKARYCVMGGYLGKQIVDYQRMDEFRERIAPYALSRPASTLGLREPIRQAFEVRLTPRTWRFYTAMRDECLAALDTWEEGTASVALQASVQRMRLCQILAGFVGGVRDYADDDAPETVQEVGSEKLDALMEFLAARNVPRPVIWGRFRPERARIAEKLQAQGYVVHLLQGGQKPSDRLAALAAFAPGGSPAGCRIALVGHPGAGGAGVSLAGSPLGLYMTNPDSLIHRQQSEGRQQRPGQEDVVQFIDFIASGPDGQRTVDHAILESLRKNEDIATWTAAAWRRALEG